MNRELLQHSSEQRERSLECFRRMEALGIADEPLKQLYWELGNSRLREGQIADKFGGRLSRQLDELEHIQDLEMAKSPEISTIDSKSSIHLGNVIGRDQEYRLDHAHLPQGIMIGGATGAGKTVLSLHLAKQLCMLVPLTISDGKDEAGRFERQLPNAVIVPLEKQRFNMLRARRDQRGFVRYLAHEMGKALALHRVTVNDLSKILWQVCRNPDDLPAIADLVPVLDRFAEKSKRTNLHTAARSIEDLVVLMGDWARVRSGPDLFADEKRVLILPRKDLPPVWEYLFYALLFKDRTDAISLRGHSTKMAEAFIFDEARGFFGDEFENRAGSGRFNIQTELVTKARSYGLCLVIASQSISRLQRVVVDNAATFIAMRTNSEAEAKFCARRLGLPDERHRELMELETGLAYVVSPSCPRPVKISIPYHDLGNYPSEESIAEKMGPIWASWDTQTQFAGRREVVETPLDFRKIIGEKATEDSVEHDEASPDEPGAAKDEVNEELDTPIPDLLDEFVLFLSACREGKNRGVTALYRKLGWSAGRGHRVKTQLVESGLVETSRSRSPKGGRPAEVVQLTSKGERFLSHHE